MAIVTVRMPKGQPHLEFRRMFIILALKRLRNQNSYFINPLALLLTRQEKSRVKLPDSGKKFWGKPQSEVHQESLM